MKTLAERLAWARTQKEWSQQQLADKARVAQSTIASLESGARLSARKITTIAAALGVSSDWLAEGKGSRDSTPYITEAPPPPTVEPRLQWVTDDESEMLSLYRACEQSGRDTTLVILRSLAKAIVDSSRSDQG